VGSNPTLSAIFPNPGLGNRVAKTKASWASTFILHQRYKCSTLQK
jgi:hypothetical protein